MKYLAKIVLLILNLCILISAQSGRKIGTAPVPNPAPVVIKTPEPDYSESQPVQKHSVNPISVFRGVSGAPSPAVQPDVEAAGVDTEVVKVETNLVTIPVSVFDRYGLYIPSLEQKNFKVFENGKEQEIGYFDTSEKPFTVILLLDTSPSTEFKIEEIQDAARSFVDRLKTQDNVMVIEFAKNVHILTEPTNDREKISKAIKKADFGGGTSLYDAVDFSLRKRLSKIEGRKAIVLFTDGVDTTSSKIGYDGTLAEAEEADALIFPIYFNTFDFNSKRTAIRSPFPFPGTRRISARGTSAEDYALGKKYLEDLAAYTGGRVFNADSTVTGLEDAFTGIADELRRQYNIGYYPADPGQPGQRKQIKIRVDRPNLVIRARDSYIVGILPDGEK